MAKKTTAAKAATAPAEPKPKATEPVVATPAKQRAELGASGVYEALAGKHTPALAQALADYHELTGGR